MNDERFLRQAIALAAQSEEPVKCGSVIVDGDGIVLAAEYNSQRADNMTAAHAEMKAVAAANRKRGRKLKDATAYGNCEPCTMCLTALIFAGVERIVFAERLNDIVEPGQQISIDCYSFVKNFPYQPKIQQLKIEA